MGGESYPLEVLADIERRVHRGQCWIKSGDSAPALIQVNEPPLLGSGLEGARLDSGSLAAFDRGTDCCATVARRHGVTT